MRISTSCAAELTFGFDFFNPVDAQKAQLVTISAGPVGTSQRQWQAGLSSAPQEMDVDNDVSISPISVVLTHEKAPLRIKTITVDHNSRIFHRGGGLCTEAKVMQKAVYPVHLQ